ncbi:MAG: hypothetical protein ACC628_17110, partial [Pirellulaceae bacterium]
MVLNSEPTANVTIDFSSSDTTEGTVSPTSLSFQPGDWKMPKTVTVTGVDDDLDDGDIAYTIVTAAASSADPKYDGLNPENVSVTNEDDDVQSLVVSPLNVIVNEGGTSEFTVKLAAKPTSNVTVNIAKQFGGDPDLAASPTSLTFTSGDWKTAQPVAVSAGQDPDTISGTAQFLLSSTGLASKTVTVTEGDDEPQIIDNGESGFRTEGKWSQATGQGYKNDVRFAAKGSGSAKAIWTFSVEPGQYDVAATWSTHKNRATDAPYTVLSGSTPLRTIDLNQELAPNDFTEGVGWKNLGTFTITGNTL